MRRSFMQRSFIALGLALLISACNSNPHRPGVADERIERQENPDALECSTAYFNAIKVYKERYRMTDDMAHRAADRDTGGCMRRRDRAN